jgi:hypothetical protein
MHSETIIPVVGLQLLVLPNHTVPPDMFRLPAGEVVSIEKIFVDGETIGLHVSGHTPLYLVVEPYPYHGEVFNTHNFQVV